MSQQPFTFYSQGRELRGTLNRAEGEEIPAAVLCHGFGSYDDDLGAFARLAERLAHAGIASLYFSFTGSDSYAEKGTIRPTSEWVPDCLAAVAALQCVQGIDSQRIGLLGISVGGGVVVQATALCPDVRCVVALAPAADGRDWLHYRWLLTKGEAAWNEFVARVYADARRLAQGSPSETMSNFDIQAMPDEDEWNEVLGKFPRILSELTLASVWDTFHFRPVNYVQDIAPRPLRIVHGDADESVPLTHAWELYGRARQVKDLQVLRDAPHCCWETQWEDQVLSLSLAWFEEHL